MLKHRLITGPILVAALLLIVWLDDRLDAVRLAGFWQELFMGKVHPPRGLILFGLGLLVTPLAGLELSAIFRANGIRTRAWLTSAAAMLGLVLSYSVPTRTENTPGTEAIFAIAIVSTGMIIVFVASLLTFSRQKKVEGVVAAAGAVVFAMVYLGLMIGFLLALRRSHSAWWIVGVILTTKACDTGAFFTGRAIGRHRMIPWLSPGKTWEGLAGGIVLSVIVGLALAAASQAFLGETDHVPLWLGLLCGVIFAIVGQCGDLTMSLFKRGAGLKDASQLLPGLGGVLDVLDSPLLVAPVAFWLLELAA
ncbi:MAG: phosphatidate cytidylyltransferase [Planctomycetota bacterium]|nr:phosphatidate cytidylyltransferase [Planctomycetota bacterium]